MHSTPDIITDINASADDFIFHDYAETAPGEKISTIFGSELYKKPKRKSNFLTFF